LHIVINSGGRRDPQRLTRGINWELLIVMIVCSCNVLTDHDVRNVVSASEEPITTSEVYSCLGCSRQCGRCTRTIKKIMNEAMTDACTSNCTLDHHHHHHRHGHHHDRHDHHHNHAGEPAAEFALAAAAA